MHLSTLIKEYFLLKKEESSLTNGYGFSVQLVLKWNFSRGNQHSLSLFMYEISHRVLFVLISQEQNLHPVRIYNKTKIFEMKEKVTLLCMGVYSECQVMQVNTERCALTC